MWKATARSRIRRVKSISSWAWQRCCRCVGNYKHVAACQVYIWKETRKKGEWPGARFSSCSICPKVGRNLLDMDVIRAVDWRTDPRNCPRQKTSTPENESLEKKKDDDRVEEGPREARERRRGAKRNKCCWGLCKICLATLHRLPFHVDLLNKWFEMQFLWCVLWSWVESTKAWTNLKCIQGLLLQWHSETESMLNAVGTFWNECQKSHLRVVFLAVSILQEFFISSMMKRLWWNAAGVAFEW